MIYAQLIAIHVCIFVLFKNCLLIGNLKNNLKFIIKKNFLRKWLWKTFLLYSAKLYSVWKTQLCLFCLSTWYISKMVFLAILSVISFALLSPCLSQNQLKCSVLNVLGDKQLVRFGTSWISTEIHGNTNSFNGTKDRELNLCDRSQKGPAVNSATLQAFKTVPDISKLDDGT